MNGTEQDFVHRINVKDEAAFHDLFTRFRNYLVLFAMRRVEQLDVAEDIVQETFITVWENKKTFNSYQGLKAYLYELVQNKCTNYLKHRQVEDKYASYVKTTGEEAEGDYSLMQEEIYRELYMAVRELPEKCQRVSGFSSPVSLESTGLMQCALTASNCSSVISPSITYVTAERMIGCSSSFKNCTHCTAESAL